MAYNGKLADPEWRRERARKAGLVAHNLDRYVERVVARAPELTPEQLDRLRGLFRSVTDEGVTDDAG